MTSHSLNSTFRGPRTRDPSRLTQIFGPDHPVPHPWTRQRKTDTKKRKERVQVTLRSFNSCAMESCMVLCVISRRRIRASKIPPVRSGRPRDSVPNHPYSYPGWGRRTLPYTTGTSVPLPDQTGTRTREGRRVTGHRPSLPESRTPRKWHLPKSAHPDLTTLVENGPPRDLSTPPEPRPFN